ncbi:MAG: hypothetical protein OEV47_18210 [Gammaproteobacteria bacterium]|nr:hypothetical protein [Gammaproteobacteria bacterium]
MAATAAGAAAFAGWRYAYLPELSGISGLGSRTLFFSGGSGASLLALLDTLAPSDAVGRSWLASQEQRPQLVELMQLLARRLEADTTSLQRAVAAQIRRDFLNGDVCDVQGWQLSVTECQLSGLRQLALDDGLLQPPEEMGQADAAEAYTDTEIAVLTGWGPQETLQGKGFNTQLDGHSGMWFKLAGVPGHAKIMIDGEIARTSVREGVVTSGLRGEMQQRILATPGEYEVALVDPIRRTRQLIGFFTVKADPSMASKTVAPAEDFCSVEQWGPRTTRAGVAVNEQPDGSMGLWLHTSCLPEGSRLLFGEDPLDYRRREFGLTAAVPLALLGAPGSVPLKLYNAATNKTLLIGQFVIK